MLVLLKDKAYTLSSLGESKVESRPVEGVKVSSPGHRDVLLFFDKDTALLVKRERQVTDARTGKDSKQETFYGDYKEINGFKFPMKVTTKVNGHMQREEERFDFKPVEKLNDNAFAEP